MHTMYWDSYAHKHTHIHAQTPVIIRTNNHKYTIHKQTHTQTLFQHAQTTTNKHTQTQTQGTRTTHFHVCTPSKRTQYSLYRFDCNRCKENMELQNGSWWKFAIVNKLIFQNASKIKQTSIWLQTVYSNSFWRAVPICNEKLKCCTVLTN